MNTLPVPKSPQPEFYNWSSWQLEKQVRPDELGGLIWFLYTEYAAGQDVPPNVVIQMIRLAA